MTYTIAREINGVKTEIELTAEEIRDIHQIQKDEYDREDVEQFCEEMQERGDDPLTDAEKESLRKRYVYYRDNSEDWWTCLENAYYIISRGL